MAKTRPPYPAESRWEAPEPPQLWLAEPRSGPTPERKASNATAVSTTDPDARLKRKPGPDMLQVSPNGRQLWTSNRFTGTASVISTKSGHVIRTITVGASPHGLAYFPNRAAIVLAIMASIAESPRLGVAEPSAADHGHAPSRGMRLRRAVSPCRSAT